MHMVCRIRASIGITVAFCMRVGRIAAVIAEVSMGMFNKSTPVVAGTITMGVLILGTSFRNGEFLYSVAVAIGDTVSGIVAVIQLIILVTDFIVEIAVVGTSSGIIIQHDTVNGCGSGIADDNAARI